MKNKRGAVEFLQDNIVVIVAIILLFSGLMFFVHKSSTGAVVYEEVYAKQISLIIEKAKPDSEVILDFREGFEIARENDLGESPDVIEIDNSENKVIIKIGSRGGYSSYYFSDYSVEAEEMFDEEKIKLTIKEK